VPAHRRGGLWRHGVGLAGRRQPHSRVHHAPMSRCPHCGARASKRGPSQLCPGCLMASVLDGDTDHDIAEDASWLDIPYQIVTVIARHTDGATYLARPIGGAGRIALKIVGPRGDVPAMLDRMRTWKAALTRFRDPHV